jgi:hypothetical protein
MRFLLPGEEGDRAASKASSKLSAVGMVVTKCSCTQRRLLGELARLAEKGEG